MDNLLILAPSAIRFALAVSGTSLISQHEHAAVQHVLESLYTFMGSSAPSHSHWSNNAVAYAAAAPALALWRADGATTTARTLVLVSRISAWAFGEITLWMLYLTASHSGLEANFMSTALFSPVALVFLSRPLQENTSLFLLSALLLQTIHLLHDPRRPELSRQHHRLSLGSSLMLIGATSALFVAAACASGRQLLAGMAAGPLLFLVAEMWRLRLYQSSMHYGLGRFLANLFCLGSGFAVGAVAFVLEQYMVTGRLWITQDRSFLTSSLTEFKDMALHVAKILGCALLLFGRTLPVASWRALQVQASIVWPSTSRSKKDSLLVESFAASALLPGLAACGNYFASLSLADSVLLLGPACLLASAPKQPRAVPTAKPSRWLVPFMHALVGATVFGFLLQGGLLPALSNVEESLASTESLPNHVLFWRVPTVPPYLTLPTVEPDSESADLALKFLDLGHAASVDDLYDSLRRSRGSRTWLVAPAYLVKHLPDRDLLFNSSFGFHLDEAYLQDYWQARWQDMGVGIWSFG